MIEDGTAQRGSPESSHEPSQTVESNQRIMQIKLWALRRLTENWQMLIVVFLFTHQGFDAAYKNAGRPPDTQPRWS